MSDSDLAGALDHSIDYQLASAEAARLAVFKTTEAEATHLVRTFATRFPAPSAYQAFLQRHEASEGSLATILERELRVERYVDKWVQMQARISDEQIQEYFRAHAVQLPVLTLEEAREQIRAELARTRYASLVQRLFAELRSKAEIRLVAPFARNTARKGALEGDTRGDRP